MEVDYKKKDPLLQQLLLHELEKYSKIIRKSSKFCKIVWQYHNDKEYEMIMKISKSIFGLCP